MTVGGVVGVPGISSGGGRCLLLVLLLLLRLGSSLKEGMQNFEATSSWESGVGGNTDERGSGGLDTLDSERVIPCLLGRPHAAPIPSLLRVENLKVDGAQ